ncbi:MAG: nicotinate phosphoribosyltransferase [Tenericutes bacterium GWC2_39_45]|nr:MAG: nicotinate phosphoribosyltransferase [Tenericutes bacterium GWA2_38_26]OHE31028.1 MAG: nicotinate phosphoribosyltransferase [Tenericutes bacterium GWC2_39_45]OHE32187.1 MAG: nicotinate phosphoribosyltransferase [Tenericutes bacterium GWD2_38_27]OHE40868.1 MAG: nicotinate phosphoribosyltransferase [Tenericutes bacterium GWE2_38_8]OHE43034.1 MAG: nicotinate phosphoribosyltransferase [Tenericutes bacterium GWF2_38_8]HCB67161.1 nicotinate phosphoribosyltransferase [Acholeplasmataceae bacte
MNERKLTLLMDFYELTMANGYFRDNKHNQIAVFDVFFRSIPDDGGYAVFAGLEQVVEYIKHLEFNDEEINFLRSKKVFNEDFLYYLKHFKFSCDVYSMKEGTPIFPHEPIMIVKGPLLDCQLIETYVLLTINHQSLIATKAARIVYAAEGRNVLEFGARRAHGYDASIYGARAAYISGVLGSSNTYVDYKFQIPALGTMAHSYVQSYGSEYEAFTAYANTYPDNTLLLVDTYNTLKQGIPNAIKIHKEILEPKGFRLKGIRLDSGDLTYLTKEARKMLDQAGLKDTKITVSNSLDEYLIKELIHQGAQIDTFGVGERLITARSEAVFGGVFKLSAIEVNGELVPKIKISDNIQKTTIPGFKQVYRFYDESGKAEADVITLHDEKINPDEPYHLFDPNFPWKDKVIENFKVVPLLIPIFIKGKLVYELPRLNEIRAFAKEEHTKLWDEVTRLEKPHEYYVDLSQTLWDLKQELIKKYKK